MSQIMNKDVFQALEEWAPLHLAYDWDNVGLQIGSYHNKVKKIMVTLDVLEAVVDEAIENNVDLIIAHHPLFFKAIKQIDTESLKGRIIQKLMKHNITVYATHTNLDIAKGGINDMLMNQLSINSSGNLINTNNEKLYKIAVFVPRTHVDQVRHALHLGGAGHIGNYSHCAFQTPGKGTFKPLEGTDPYIGQKNQLEMIDEMKVETIVKERDLHNVITEMKKAHPYEEVAYDIIPLFNKSNSPLGLGRIGSLDESVTFEQFTQYVKKCLKLSHVRVVGNLSKQVQKVAVLGGSGEKYIHQAMNMGADVYITGDMSFHIAQDAMELGLCVIDAGHYIEKVMKKTVQDMLVNKLKEQELEIIISNIDTEPFQFI